MDEQRAKHEFRRMQYHQEVERRREFIAQYEQGLAFARRAVEDARYEIGRLDERLGADE